VEHEYVQASPPQSIRLLADKTGTPRFGDFMPEVCKLRHLKPPSLQNARDRPREQITRKIISLFPQTG
jgi:hypothetical protein